jgi:hypothetical protein
MGNVVAARGCFWPGFGDQRPCREGCDCGTELASVHS